MNKKMIGFAAIPVLGISIFAVDAVSAHGFGSRFSASPEDVTAHHEEMFKQKANILGISVDEVKSAWAEGKNWEALAKEKGITKEQIAERMKAGHEDQLKLQMKALVDKGVITQAQADKRVEPMKTKIEKGGGRVPPSLRSSGGQEKIHSMKFQF